MSDTRGVLIIGSDAVLKGDVKNARRVEVHGYVEGGVAAGDVFVHNDGRLFGSIKSETAEVRGTLQGDVRVNQLMAIKSTGSVNGTVKYGRLSMDEGASLSATVRNIPPSIAGDLDVTVNKGRSVRIMLADLSALDPDDKAENLIFKVSKARGGSVTQSSAPGTAVDTFTQADLESGRVHFAHDGGDAATASFDVIVSDNSGATSGPAKTVNVAVRV